MRTEKPGYMVNVCILVYDYCLLFAFGICPAIFNFLPFLIGK